MDHVGVLRQSAGSDFPLLHLRNRDPAVTFHPGRLADTGIDREPQRRIPEPAWHERGQRKMNKKRVAKVRKKKAARREELRRRPPRPGTVLLLDPGEHAAIVRQISGVIEDPDGRLTIHADHPNAGAIAERVEVTGRARPRRAELAASAAAASNRAGTVEARNAELAALSDRQARLIADVFQDVGLEVPDLATEEGRAKAFARVRAARPRRGPGPGRRSASPAARSSACRRTMTTGRRPHSASKTRARRGQRSSRRPSAAGSLCRLGAALAGATMIVASEPAGISDIPASLKSGRGSRRDRMPSRPRQAGDRHAARRGSPVHAPGAQPGEQTALAAAPAPPACRFAGYGRRGSPTVIGERSATMGYTLGQAAKAAGKSKTTILRAPQKSKISGAKDAHGQVEHRPGGAAPAVPRRYGGERRGGGSCNGAQGQCGRQGTGARGADRGAAPGPRRVARPGAAAVARAPGRRAAVLAPSVRLSRGRGVECSPNVVELVAGRPGRSTTKAARMPVSEIARDPKSPGTVRRVREGLERPGLADLDQR